MSSSKSPTPIKMFPEKSKLNDTKEQWATVRTTWQTTELSSLDLVGVLEKSSLRGGSLI